MSSDMLNRIEKTIKNEYALADDEPDYKCFLKAKFNFWFYSDIMMSREAVILWDYLIYLRKRKLN